MSVRSLARWHWAYGYAAVVALGLVGALTIGSANSYTQQLMFLSASGAIAALCMYLVVGLSGQFALITNALIGVGAYAAALATMRLGWGHAAAVLFAAVLAGLLGLVIGVIALRVRGHYLALASVGFSIIIVQILTNWRSVTRGSSALTGIPKPGTLLGLDLGTRQGITMLTLLLLAAFALVALLLERSGIGIAAKILRQDEELAESVGIDTFRVKVTIFAFSGVVLGGLGALHAWYLGLLQPDMFAIFGTVDHLIMVIVGGFSVLGAIVGSLVVTLLPEYLRFLGHGRELVLGIALLVVVLGAPQGLVGLAQGLVRGTAKRLRPAPEEPRQDRDESGPHRPAEYGQVGS